nr:MAG TPA: hypothetical protein [Caudoviricetes sp.]
MPYVCDDLHTRRQNKLPFLRYLNALLYST